MTKELLLCHSAPDKTVAKGIVKGYLATFLHKIIFCDQSLEPSHQDGSNEGSQHMFRLRNKKNYL